MTLTLNTHISSLTQLVVCIYQLSGQTAIVYIELKIPLFSLFLIEKPKFDLAIK